MVTNNSWLKRKIGQIVVSALASNGAFIAGSNLGWSAQSQHRLTLDKEYGFAINDFEFAWISSLLPLGASLGGLIAGYVFNRFGRKWTILAFYIPFLVGWQLMIWAVVVEMMYAGRFTLGLCSGAFTAVIPVYICEVAEKDIRGMLAGFQQLLIVIGIAVSYTLGAFVNVFITNIILCVMPLIFSIPFIFAPESPQYLIMQGKEDAARKSMKWLYGDNIDVDKMLNELQVQNYENEAALNRVGWSEIKQFKVWYALLIAIGLQFFLVLSGMDAVLFYSNEIFQKGSRNLNPSSATVIMGVVQIVATSLSIGVVDKLGRKMLLIVSGVVMSFNTGTLGLYFSLMNHHKALPTWIPFISIYIFLIGISLGFGPVPWIVLGEMFAPNWKGFACASAVFTNWILTFVVTFTFTHFVAWIGVAGTFWMFTAITAAGVIFVIFVVVETKGLSLNEVQKKIAERKAYGSSILSFSSIYM